MVFTTYFVTFQMWFPIAIWPKVENNFFECNKIHFFLQILCSLKLNETVFFSRWLNGKWIRNQFKWITFTIWSIILDYSILWRTCLFRVFSNLLILIQLSQREACLLFNSLWIEWINMKLRYICVRRRNLAHYHHWIQTK